MEFNVDNMSLERCVCGNNQCIKRNAMSKSQPYV